MQKISGTYIFDKNFIFILPCINPHITGQCASLEGRLDRKYDP